MSQGLTATQTDFLDNLVAQLDLPTHLEENKENEPPKNAKRKREPESRTERSKQSRMAETPSSLSTTQDLDNEAAYEYIYCEICRHLDPDEIVPPNSYNVLFKRKCPALNCGRIVLTCPFHKRYATPHAFCRSTRSYNESRLVSTNPKYDIQKRNLLQNRS